MKNNAGTIRAGIGGWTYEPWDQTFYPADLPKKNQLHYASRHVTAIEINGTFYRLQKPEVFAKWRDDTPDDFVFSIKAPRHIVSRRNLAEATESIQRFVDSGLAQLGTKLGPILWQLPPTKTFAATEVAALCMVQGAVAAKHETFAASLDDSVQLCLQHILIERPPVLYGLHPRLTEGCDEITQGALSRGEVPAIGRYIEDHEANSLPRTRIRHLVAHGC